MSKKPFAKTKLEERVLNELNICLRSVINDPRLKFISITKVELNGDFSQAKCFWDTYDSSIKEDVQKNIHKVAPRLRGHISQNVELRHTPELVFEYDNQFESEQNIIDLLSSNRAQE